MGTFISKVNLSSKLKTLQFKSSYDLRVYLLASKGTTKYFMATKLAQTYASDVII